MTLFKKIFLAVLASGLLAMTVAAIFFSTTVRGALRDQISLSQLNITEQTADKIDRLLNERRIDVQALAQRNEHVQAVSSRATKTELATSNKSLTDFKTTDTSWSSLTLIDAKGVTKVSTEPADLEAGLLGQDKTLADLYQQSLAGRSVYSDVFVNAKTKQPNLVFMSPLYDNGSVVGVVAARVAWTAIRQIINSVDDATTSLLNRNGIVIMDSRSAKVLELDYSKTSAFAEIKQKQTGSAVLADFTMPKQQAVMSYVVEPGFSGYQGNGWYLVVDTPTSQAFSAAQKPVLTIIITFSLLIVLSMLTIIWILNHQALRPIRALMAAVTRVALGDLSQTVPVTSKDELGGLAHNFNEMTYQLASTHKTLQSASQAASEGQAKLEASINGLRQGFIMTNNKGKLTLVNAAAKTIISEGGAHKRGGRITLDDLLGLLPKALKLEAKIARTLKTGQQDKLANVLLSGRFLNLYLSPVSNDGQIIGCALLLEDVTEERIMQRSRDEFFSIASHELRTPLTAIRGNTTLIQQYFPETLKDPQMAEMIEDIHGSSIRLIEIVNDFLDASRLEQDKMKFAPQPFAVEEVIEKVIYEMSGLSRDKEIYLNFDQNTLGEIPPVFADKNRVKQVIYNLVGNAMKFTEKGGVTINCLSEQHMLKICVTDTGPGISLEGQQLLFHKFQQTGDSILTRDNTRGTGLGLYISKLLVEHMGGRVTLEHSELGHGTTFSFSLPYATPEQVQKMAA